MVERADYAEYELIFKLKLACLMFFCVESPLCDLLLIVFRQKLFKCFSFRNTHSKIFETFFLFPFQAFKDSVKFSFLFLCLKNLINPVFSFY